MALRPYGSARLDNDPDSLWIRTIFPDTCHSLHAQTKLASENPLQPMGDP